MFFLILLLYAILFLIYNRSIMHENRFYVLFDSFSKAEIQHTFVLLRKWEWLSIILNLFIILLRIISTTTIIYIGFFFFDKRIPFSKIFLYVTICEVIFIMQLTVRIIYFSILPPTSLNDLKIIPLSILSLLSYEKIDEWMYYALNLFNMFDLVYFIALCFIFSKKQHLSLKKSFNVIFYTYGIGLFLVMIFISFLQLYRI
jgi:hypothetical protein